jgi:hypothetical protein
MLYSELFMQVSWNFGCRCNLIDTTHRCLAVFPFFNSFFRLAVSPCIGLHHIILQLPFLPNHQRLGNVFEQLSFEIVVNFASRFSLPDLLSLFSRSRHLGLCSDRDFLARAWIEISAPLVWARAPKYWTRWQNELGVFDAVHCQWADDESEDD